jgi:hypothetical protein
MRRGQPLGPTNDQEVEDFIYDALDLLPGAIDVDVRCETGRVTLSGAVQHKRVKTRCRRDCLGNPGCERRAEQRHDCIPTTDALSRP